MILFYFVPVFNTNYFAQIYRLVPVTETTLIYALIQEKK